MRRLFAFLSIAAALVSCNKENLDIEGGEGTLCRADFTFKVAGSQSVETKGEVTGTGDDDFIERLDLFEYVGETGKLVKHKTWSDSTGLDLSKITYTCYGTYNTRHTFIVLANFDQPSIDFLSSLDGVQIGDEKIAILPLQGLFRLHKSLMGSSGFTDFKKAETFEFTLYRYVTKMVIKNIVAEFADSSYYDKDVKLKTVTFTGVTNVLRPVHYKATKITSFNEDAIYGDGISNPETPGFAGLVNGYMNFNDMNQDSSFDFGGTFNPGTHGAKYLAADYHYVLNDNRNLAEGVLNIDVTDDMFTATCENIPDDEGVLASSTDSAVSHSYVLDRQFYTFNLNRSYYYALYGETGQDNTQKLVFEVEIDGVTHFYIVMARRLCPNYIYTIHNVKIKGPGSSYSNKYPQLTKSSLCGVSDDGHGNVSIGTLIIGGECNDTEECL